MKRPDNQIVNLVPRKVEGRVPPHDLDAEAAVLSTVLMTGQEGLDRVIDILRQEHFYSTDGNGWIYAAAVALSAAGTPIDAATVASWLDERGRLQRAGGLAYLAQLADATPSPFHLEAHARIVRSRWHRRQIIATCQKIAAEGYEPVPDEEFNTGAIAAIEEAAGVADEAPRGATARESIRELWTTWENPSDEIAMSTGLLALDRRIGGLYPGHLVTIAAYSGHGKSALAAGIADHVAVHELAAGKPCGVAVFTLEMKRGQYMTRMVSARARVNNAKLINPRLRDRLNEGAERGIDRAVEEWRAITEATRALDLPHLHIDDRDPIRPSEIRATSRRLAAQWKRAGHPLRLVVIDYAQIVTPDIEGRRGDSREREVASIGRAAKSLAGELGVAVILLAQLNKDALKANRRPRARDMRESGALEQDSNAVVIIYNPAAEERAEQDAQSPPKPLEEVDLIVDKARDGGSKGTARVLFRPTCTRFESRADEGPEPDVE